MSPHVLAAHHCSLERHKVIERIAEEVDTSAGKARQDDEEQHEEPARNTDEPVGGGGVDPRWAVGPLVTNDR